MQYNRPSVKNCSKQLIQCMALSQSYSYCPKPNILYCTNSLPKPTGLVFKIGAKCPKLCSFVIDISVAQNLGTGHQQYLDKKHLNHVSKDCNVIYGPDMMYLLHLYALSSTTIFPFTCSLGH